MERIKKYEPLWGKWNVKKIIGEGSFSVVYEVECEIYGNKRKNAVKLISFKNTEILQGIGEEKTLSEKELEQLKIEEARKNVREAVLMEKLEGRDHIVTIHDYDIFPKEYTTDVIIRMELLTNLNDYIKEHRTDSKSDLKKIVIKLGIDIGQALEECEAEKIVHRDIKPDNIFINKNGTFKLGDFGLSRKMSKSASFSLRKSAGTPLYMAPEALGWGSKVDALSDIYSLGIVMYQLLNDGNIPFVTDMRKYDEVDKAIGRRIDGEKIVPPKYEDGELWKIIQKACQFEKKDRYQYASELREDLEKLRYKEINDMNEENDSHKEKVEKKDYKEEIEQYKKAAEQGDAVAQCNLGRRYYKGEGVEKDNKEAVRWWRKAAERGNANAQYNLGIRYYYGEGVEKDNKETVRWWRKAAEQGNANAQNNLGECYYYGEGIEKNYKEAVKWYKKAAERGNANAQNALGYCYSNGKGVEKDNKEAVRWWRKAAEQGNAIAQYNLGIRYYYGEGVEKDNKEAVRWCEKAAEQGNANAQNALGYCYSNGKGVEKDNKEAVRWYKKAAEQGNVTAQTNLGNRYYRGEGIEKDNKEAVRWYKKAAERGDAVAQTNLGNRYYRGEGVEKSYKEAIRWWKEAAEQGNVTAQNNLNRYFENDL